MDQTNDDVETVVETFFDQLQDVKVPAPPTHTQISVLSAGLPDDELSLIAEDALDASVEGPSKAAGLADVDPLQTDEVAVTVPPTYVQLSALLAGLPDDELSLIVEGTLDAVVKGVFRAARLVDTFKIAYRDTNGKRIRRTMPDLAISPSPEFEAWLLAQRRESRHRAMVWSGKVQTTMQRIVSGEDDFEKLADLTRRTLAQQRTKKKK